MRNLLIVVALSLLLGLTLVITSFRSSDQETEQTGTQTTTNTETETNNGSSSTSTTTPSSQTQTDRVENEYFVFERVVPAEVVPGERYTITLRFEAKQSLQLLAYSEDELADFVLTSGQLQNIRTGLDAGESFEDQYEIEITTGASSITLTGAARVPTGDDDGGLLRLDSEIAVLQ